ncbi:sarcosine oxidase subunit gamma family protein [Kalamiella sp. sgz302252]|uniref:sarcosine oxidase subunit gamma family protein n=1 Tax=Pantoea sp. sgz302252 TaxID=3341827 RepID=UPI0036D3B6D0
MMQRVDFPQAASPLAHLTSALTAGAANRPAFSDLSNCTRVGFRGRHAAWYLQQQGFVLPDRPNQACWQNDGSLVARLSMTEYLLLAEPPQAQERLRKLERQWQPGELACYLLPRQDTHAWLTLRGEAWAEAMAKLCAVDLSAAAFPAGSIAQTSVARASAIVINAATQDKAQFWLLVDYSMAAYYWTVLQDAIDEFGGAAVA